MRDYVEKVLTWSRAEMREELVMAIVDRSLVRRWLREPLCRFLLLGAVLLGVDSILGRERFVAEDEAPRIVVSASRKAAIADAFRVEHRRAPSAQELAALLDRWLDDEVLYREALALGLDRRDVVVKRQLTQKMRFLIEDATMLPEPSEAELQTWLDEHPERYGRGPLVSFEHVFTSRGRHGKRLAAEAARVAAELRRAPESFFGLGDPFLVGQVVTDVDADRIRRDFGPGFAEALAAAPTGEWSEPIASAFGLHLVRVTARTLFTPGRLADVVDRVRVDLELERRARRNRAALAELRKRYTVAVEDAPA